MLVFGNFADPISINHEFAYAIHRVAPLPSLELVCTDHYIPGIFPFEIGFNF